MQLHEETGGKVLVVELGGKLTTEDYSRFVPEVDRQIGVHGKIRVLVKMTDFHGWTLGAVWEDIKFDVKHFAHVDRVAIVGNRKWEAAMAIVCKPFTLAKVRYFDESHAKEALDWVHEGLDQKIESVSS
jgi:hypothetical protein